MHLTQEPENLSGEVPIFGMKTEVHEKKSGRVFQRTPSESCGLGVFIATQKDTGLFSLL